MSGADTATPFDLALRLVDQIPKEKFNTKALVPGSGYACPFPLALVHRGWDPANIACIENSPAYVALTSAAMRELGVEVLCQDLLTWLTHMRFDVVIGNPPYNNRGKVKGQKNTSGTSLWVQFLRKIPELMAEGSWCSLLVPSAVGNTNSVGWRAIRSTRVESIKTGLSEQYFKVGTAISQVTFIKDEPSSTMEINGEVVDRSQMVVAPLDPNPIAVGIMYKLQNTGTKMNWKRTNFPTFVKIAQANPSVIGMPALDRGNHLRPRSLEALTSGKNLSKCEMLSIEVDNQEAFIEVLKHPLLRFFHTQSASTGNLTLGSIREITLPDGWETINLFKSYSLTTEETNFIKEWTKVN